MKNLFKFLITGILLTYVSNVTYAQSDIKPLKVGDQCPDFIFNNIVNSDKSTLKLSDFKGKLVILDFWATWCGPCVSSLPELDMLQKKYQNKLVVLPISNEPTQLVVDFLKTKTSLKGISLPSVTKDTLMKKFFPHNAIPHEVWIDGTGKVAAITRADGVNSQNIDLMLAGKGKQVKNKVADLPTIAYSDNPLLFGAFGPGYQLSPKLVGYSSVITDYINGSLGMHSNVREYNNLLWYRAVNVPILTLYTDAFMVNNKFMAKDPNFYFAQLARTILEVRDSSIFLGWAGHSEKDANKTAEGRVFCFEMMAPKADSTKFNDYMVADLNRFFGAKYGIEGVKEKRMVDCWALTRTSNEELAKTRGEKPFTEVGKNNDFMILKNISVRDMMFWFASRYMANNKIPIIDESGYEGNIDVDIRAQLNDPAAVGKALEKYGFTFKKVKRKLDLIVIRDKKI